MNWINVKDKMPEEGQEVLCYAKSYCGRYSAIFQANYRTCFNKHMYHEDCLPFAVKMFFMENTYMRMTKGKIFSPESMGVFHKGEIVYWQPLELPDGEH